MTLLAYGVLAFAVAATVAGWYAVAVFLAFVAIACDVLAPRPVRPTPMARRR